MGNVNEPIRSPKRDVIDDDHRNEQPIEKRVKEEAESIASPDVIDTYVHVHAKEEIVEDDSDGSSPSASQQLHYGHSSGGGSGYSPEDQEERQVIEEFLASGHSRHVDNPQYGENHTLARAIAYQALLSGDYRQRYDLVSAKLRSRRIFRGLPSFCGPDAPQYSIDDSRPTSSDVRTFPSKPSNWPVDHPASSTNEEDATADSQQGSVEGGLHSVQQMSELARKNEELTEEVAYWKSNATCLLYTNRELQRRLNVLTQQLAEEASEAVEERERDRERIDELIYELRTHDQYWAQQQMQYPEQQLQYPPQQLPYPEPVHQLPQYDQAWTQQMQQPYPMHWESTNPEPSFPVPQYDQALQQKMEQRDPMHWASTNSKSTLQVPQYDQTWTQQRGLPVFPAAMKWVQK